MSDLLKNIQEEIDNSEWVGDNGVSDGLNHSTVEVLVAASFRIRELEDKITVQERQINDLRDFIKGQSKNALKFLELLQERTDE